MSNMDSMEKGFERTVDQITLKDIKEGDKIRITTRSGSTYEFVYTTGMIIAKGEGHALEETFGSFKGVHKGEHLDFGTHHTSTVQSIVHIRPKSPEAINLSSEASLAIRAQMKIGMAGKNGVSLTTEEARAIREMYGIPQFSPNQEMK